MYLLYPGHAQDNFLNFSIYLKIELPDKYKFCNKF